MSSASDSLLSINVAAMFSNVQFLTGLSVGVILGIVFMSRKSRTASREDDHDDTSDETMTPHDGVDVAGDDIKLILVVRSDLKMGKGKAAAQCAHAAVQAYQQAKGKRPKILQKWERNGQPKIVVKCDSEDEMMKMARYSKELNLITSIIKDAGRTQIAPGSRTVLGVGPGPADAVNAVTGHLKLY